jgi:hypothetical protein
MKKKGQWWGRKIDGRRRQTKSRRTYILHKIFLQAFQKEFTFSIYTKVLHHITYEWMNKVTCPYIKAFIVAKKRLANCRHRDEQASMHHHLFPIHLKNVNSEWSYECTSNRINISGRGIMLPGHSRVSLTVITPCHLQLCIVLRKWVSKLLPEPQNTHLLVVSVPTMWIYTSYCFVKFLWQWKEH